MKILSPDPASAVTSSGVPAHPDPEAGVGPHRRRRQPPEWLDRFMGADPGLTRLRTALQAVVTIGAAMLAEYAFVKLTGALQTSTAGLGAADAAAAAALNHGVLVIAIMLGAVTGMILSFSANMYTRPKDHLLTFLVVPFPMIGGLAAGLSLGPYRIPALVSLVVVLAVGAYGRRFGPRAFIGGTLLFMGDFFGFFLNGELSLHDLGWLAAEIGIGIAVAALGQFTLFFPSQRKAVQRMLGSYIGRARQVTRAALELFDDPDDRDDSARRMNRMLVRLNETALLIDARLGDADESQERSVAALHQQLFDAELALTNTTRFAERIAHLDTPASWRRHVHDSLQAIVDRDLLRAQRSARDLLRELEVAEPDSIDASNRTKHVIVHRFAVSVLGVVDATHTWRLSSFATPTTNAAETQGSEEDGAGFAPAVQLAGGWLPGSTGVSAEASTSAGHGWRHVSLPSYSRVAIQMAVAVTGAIVLGDLLSGRRFYWAVIAAFVTFMGANNAGEQLRKGFFRVAGTVVGVVLGAYLAHVVGGHTNISIALILVVLFIALYLQRINYAFMVMGITIMVSQLYVQLDEFSDSLLLLRLEETALGAAIAALTVLFVLPLQTRRVAQVAGRNYLQALADMTACTTERLTGDGTARHLRDSARTLDAAYQAWYATVSSTVRMPFHTPAGADRTRLRQTLTATRNYARNLLVDTIEAASFGPEACKELRRADRQLTESLSALIAVLDPNDETTTGVYTRASSLLEVVATRPDSGAFTRPRQLALRDLQLIDGAAATLAEALGLAVRGLDDSDRLRVEAV